MSNEEAIVGFPYASTGDDVGSVPFLGDKMMQRPDGMDSLSDSSHQMHVPDSLPCHIRRVEMICIAFIKCECYVQLCNCKIKRMHFEGANYNYADENHSLHSGN